jgi:hypothetical protein
VLHVLKRKSMTVRLTKATIAATALATSLVLAGCYDKGSLDGTSVQLMTVEGRKFEVRVQGTGTPDQYRMLVIRATMVINPDPELESSRGQEVARRVMKDTCKGRPYQEIIGGLEGVNYRTLFECKPG